VIFRGLSSIIEKVVIFRGLSSIIEEVDLFDRRISGVVWLSFVTGDIRQRKVSQVAHSVAQVVDPQTADLAGR